MKLHRIIHIHSKVRPWSTRGRCFTDSSGNIKSGAVGAPLQNWFKNLFGFEESHDKVKEMMKIAEGVGKLPSPSDLNLISNANGKSFPIGTFSTATLKQLQDSTFEMIKNERSKTAGISDDHVFRFQYKHIVVNDFIELHHRYPQATFQIESQFNCLQIPNPSVTPEHGVSSYAIDQAKSGSISALACAAGVVYRNYFLPLTFKDNESGTTDIVGQTKDYQLNLLLDLEKELENDKHAYWEVRNGHLVNFNEEHNLRALNQKLNSLSANTRDQLKSLIRVGLHEHVGVTFKNNAFELASNDYTSSDDFLFEKGTVVTQVYTAPFLGSHSNCDPQLLEPVMRLLLEAQYEATLLAGIRNMLNHNYSLESREVFLIFLGEGMNGNDERLIHDSMGKALRKIADIYSDTELRINICHYKNLNKQAIDQIKLNMKGYNSQWKWQLLWSIVLIMMSPFFERFY